MSHPIFNIPALELNHAALAQRMLSQLDSPEWKLAGSNNDVKVFYYPNIEGGVDGFKTITEHSVDALTMIGYLGKNICTAMQEMNHLYHSGETLKLYHDNGPDDYFAVVRTNFKMPFPLTNREFLHSLNIKRLDKDTVLIMYHSVDDKGLPPVKKGFLRCPTYLSGQRITTLSNQKIRVEHMMVYELAGKISKNVQNKYFKSGHIKAYIREWQKLIDKFKS